MPQDSCGEICKHTQSIMLVYCFRVSFFEDNVVFQCHKVGPSCLMGKHYSGFIYCTRSL